MERENLTERVTKTSGNLNEQTSQIVRSARMDNRVDNDNETSQTEILEQNMSQLTKYLLENTL